LTCINKAWGLTARVFSAVTRRGTIHLTGKYGATLRMAGAALTIRIASAAIAFGSQVLVARWLGSSEFGSYVYVWTWLLLLGDLVHLGLPLTAQRFVPEYVQAGSTDLLRGYLSGSRWLTFAAATAIALLGALVVAVAGSTFDENLVLPFYLACVAIPAYALTFMTDGLARSYNWVNLALLPAYVVRPLIWIAVIAGLRAANIPLDATKIMGVLVGAAWIACVLQIVQLDRKLKAVVSKGPKRYQPRRWLSTALPVVFVWGLYTLLTSTDILVLKQFRPAEDVAHYYAAAKMLAFVSMIYFAVAASSAHRFTDYHVSGDRDGLAAFAATTVGLTFWPSLAATVFILVFGRPLLTLFGTDFTSGYPVMAILAIGVLARSSIGPAERALNVLGQQRLCAVAYSIAFAFNIIACLALAPAFGAIGAATATAGAFVIETLLLFAIVKRALGLHMFVWNPGVARPVMVRPVPVKVN
jgi:O-antigen/teichoic acid export membrane protein